MASAAHRLVNTKMIQPETAISSSNCSTSRLKLLLRGAARTLQTALRKAGEIALDAHAPRP